MVKSIKRKKGHYYILGFFLLFLLFIFWVYSPDKLLATRKFDQPAKFSKQITNKFTVIQLFYEYKIINFLSKTPEGLVNCPLDYGRFYNVDFYRNLSKIDSLELDSTGCPWMMSSKGSLSWPKLGFLNFGEDLRNSLGLSKADFYGVANWDPNDYLRNE